MGGERSKDWKEKEARVGSRRKQGWGGGGSRDVGKREKEDAGILWLASGGNAIESAL